MVNDFMPILITSTSITLTWSPPTAVVPISYHIRRRCRRVCESFNLVAGSSIAASVSSPHTSNGIPPYSQCTFDLIGGYGAEAAYLNINHFVTTLSTGMCSHLYM